MLECIKPGHFKVFKPSGRGPRCSQCASEAVQKRRRKLKAMAVELKGGECVKCGYSKSNWALDFHHMDPKKKDFSFSHKGHTISWEKWKVELEKTILVCKNCHAEIHAGM